MFQLCESSPKGAAFSVQALTHTAFSSLLAVKPVKRVRSFTMPPTVRARDELSAGHLLERLVFTTGIGLLGLLWLERPGTRGTAETLNCPTFAAPPVGNVGLVTFALLEIVSPEHFALIVVQLLT